MVMPNLPVDLVEEILSRVPAKSLTRLRSTCKGWKALFENGGFIKKHSRKAAKQSLILLLKNRRVCSMSVNLNVVAPSVEFKSALNFNSEQVRIATVFHCDGLLLCTTLDDRLVVWNPCLGETRWIQCRIDNECDTKFALGYQTNQCCRSYKILMYRYDNCDDNDVFEIYEFSSDSWRALDNVDLGCEIKPQTGVSLKGNSYYFATNGETYFLLSFDFTTEAPKLLNVPPNLSYYSVCLSVVREELFLLNHNAHKKMEIWMTNNIDSEAAISWRIFFTVDLNTYEYFPWSFLIAEGKKKAVCCTMRSNILNSKNMVNIIGVDDDQYYTEAPYGEFTVPDTIIFSYVPTLVQISTKN